MADVGAVYAQQIEAARTALAGGQPAAAEAHLAEALAVGEREFGADHPSLVVVLNELSRLYIRQSAHERAEPVLKRLLQITRAKGEDHPDVATALAGLAVAKRGLGAEGAAEQLYRQALAIREQKLPPNHMAIVITMEQLAETCAARGNLTEALTLLRRALTTREDALGAEHATVRTLRARIGELELRASERARNAAASLPDRARPSMTAPPASPARPAPPKVVARVAPAAPVAPPTMAISPAPAKVEAKLEAKVETKAEAKVEAKVEAKGEAKVEAKVDAKAEAKADTKADTKPEPAPEPKSDAPPPHPSDLVFIYQPEVPKRRAPIARDRVATPSYSVAVAAASLMATPAQLPPAPHAAPSAQVAAPSRFAPPAQRTAPAPLSSAATVPIHAGESVIATAARNVASAPSAPAAPAPAAANVVRHDAAESETQATAQAPRALDNWSARTSPKRTTLYASVSAVAVVLAIGGYLLSSHSASPSDRAPAQSVAQPLAASAGASTTSPSSAVSTPAAVAAPTALATARKDSVRTVSANPVAAPTTRTTLAVPANAAALVAPGAPTALPNVAGVDVPSVAMPNVDSVMRASTKIGRDSFSDAIGRTGSLKPTASTEEANGTSPVLIGTTPTPRYPDELRSRRTEGEVVVQFRVDEKGRVDASSMKVVQSPHELFTEAVRNVLPKFRFAPARSPESKPESATVQYRFQFTASN